jgi:transcriptional regulator with XRE-family HTH domain
MGKRPRQQPEHLAAKLLQIRQMLGASQSQLAKLLQFDKGVARISEYENGIRQPNLSVLLAYARVAGVCIDVLVDDAAELPKPPTRRIPLNGKHKRKVN